MANGAISIPYPIKDLLIAKFKRSPINCPKICQSFPWGMWDEKSNFSREMWPFYQLNLW